MSRKINIIFDISGSFTADGKDSLQVNMLMTLFSAVYKPDFATEELEIYFFQWSEELYALDLEDIYTNYTANCMKFGGIANMDKLLEYMAEVEPKSRFLLLTDGLFSQEEVKALQACLQEKEAVMVAVAVGPDADQSLLNLISCPLKRCYSPENVLTALHEICFRSYESNNPEQSAGVNTPVVPQRPRRGRR